RSFLLAWLSIRSRGGRIFLRIEDTDSPRIKDWAYQQTIDDLRWLGLDWDDWTDHSNSEASTSPLRQTERLERYQEVFEQLVDAGLIYICECTRKDVAEAASAPHDTSWPALEGDIYPGTCREKDLKAEAMSGAFCWRMSLDDEVVRWEDQFAGQQTANPARQLGDFVIAKSVVSEAGHRTFIPSYQLAVVVDDLDQGVTEVVRGDDLIFSTYRQQAIWRFLGCQPPTYFHVPLIIGEDGRRLAKRHGDTRIATLRQMGISPEAVVGFLLHSSGLLPEVRACSAKESLERFDWAAIASSPTVFSLEAALPVLRRLS
ncbi:MAG: glutamate--tRNA ligase family protein, partial [Planctomycetota bacterium]